MPESADVLLIVEVSDSTQRYGRRVKVPFYARHGRKPASDDDSRTLQEHRFPSDAPHRYDMHGKAPRVIGDADVRLIELENRLVHFHRVPSGDSYADITASEQLGVMPVAALPGVAIDLSSLLSARGQDRVA